MSLNTCVLATELVLKCSTPIPEGMILIKLNTDATPDRVNEIRTSFSTPQAEKDYSEK